MIDKNVDHGKSFSFNENVSLCFDNMISRSIPSYDLMRELVYRIACEFSDNTTVLDIGTSIGDSIYRLSKEYPDSKFIGLDESDSMIEKATERFKNHKNVLIKKHDLRNQIILDTQCNLILSILTVQFTPIEYRFDILNNIYALLNKGGVLLFVEKIIGYDSEINSLLVKLYYDFKKENGYSNEEIERKKLALEGVLVPMTSNWNQEMLKITGFRKVDCFWRCLNFCGWICIK